MRNFLKKWILLLISILILILFIIYWIFKPVDDVIGAFLVTFYIGFPIISVLTTIWICNNCKTVLKYFSPLLLIVLDFIWLAIFGDKGAIFKEFFLLLQVFLITIIPAVIVSIICMIVNKVKARHN
ncbi:MAG: hypothetical protein IK997_06945 [Bacilli bacterium]|nr:hypothetical protein [Bacilli bacterium]